MRKFLLLLFFSGIFAFRSYGQEIQVFNQQNIQIPDNSVIKVIGNPTDEQIIAAILIKNTGSRQISVNVTKEVISQIEGVNNAFYWDSYLEKDNRPQYPIALDPGELTSKFSAVYNPNFVSGSSQVRYTFYDINNPQISTSLIVEFITNNSENTLNEDNESTLSDAYPNPAESMVYFDYTLSRTVLDAKIIVRNLLGTIVADVNLEGLHGKASVNVKEFVDGIYFYSLVVDSDIKLTKKLIVKH